MSNTSLFTDFDPVSAKAFKQKIQMDLQGADYNEELVWSSPEGVHVKPFYHRDSFEPLGPIPGHPEHWNIGESFFILNEKIANKVALENLERGTESLFFIAEKAFDIEKLLIDIPEKTPLYFQCSFRDELFIKDFQSFIQEHKYPVYLLHDPIGNLVSTGNWNHSRSKDLEEISYWSDQSEMKSAFTIRMDQYADAGANAVQQLAYGLAHATEYLNVLYSRGAKAEANPLLSFQVACGGNYFFEIAKLRALRLLYQSVAKEFQLREDLHLIATPAKRNKSIYDYNTNMIRTTTEYMSAALGGADVILTQAYDSLYHKTNEFGQRIARNQLLILREESYLDAVKNPADGTYYIEAMTHELIQKTLPIYKAIEKAGGLIDRLHAGEIQRKIKEEAEKEQKRFDIGQKVLIGSNKHKNPQDRMKQELELYPFLKKRNTKTLIEPIIQRRLSEALEQERLAQES
ncbi:methylmalonyl-CoA mutase subunit beta [Croceiramulus getboli]|nr:methylmalonyl-CoA mutase subunit beta [Flavobacteriaceae bacterium YJPT1-3]